MSFQFYLKEIIFITVWLVFFVKSLSLPKQKISHEHLKFFDAIKGLSIVAIIMIHVVAYTQSNYWLMDILWAFISVFIISSGYLLYHRHTVENKKFWYHVFIRVIFVYIIFSTVYSFSFGNLNTLWFDILLGRTPTYYFIPLLIILYLIYPLLVKISGHLQTFWVQLILLLSSFGFFILDYFLQQPNWDSNPYSLVFPGRFLFFFASGILLAKYDYKSITFKKMLYPLSVFIIGAIAFSIYTHKIYLTYIYPLALFILLIAFINRIKLHSKYLESLGKYTLVIYLVHGAILFKFIGPLLNNYNFPTWLVIIGLTIILTIISHIFAIIFEYSYNKLIQYASVLRD